MSMYLQQMHVNVLTANRCECTYSCCSSTVLFSSAFSVSSLSMVACSSSNLEWVTVNRFSYSLRILSICSLVYEQEAVCISHCIYLKMSIYPQLKTFIEKFMLQLKRPLILNCNYFIKIFKKIQEILNKSHNYSARCLNSLKLLRSYLIFLLSFLYK